jgi:protoporphyrinogen oxidase
MNDKTAIIIGAGPAGLTAAYELLTKTDIRPVIIEKESFVGGISRTAEYNGNRIDIGGHRFFSKSDTVMELWKKLMPLQGMPSYDDRLLGRESTLMPGGPDPDKEDRVLLVRNRVSRIYYLRRFFDYPLSLKPQTFINMGLVNTMRAGFGYIGSALHKRPENNLEDFMINRFGKQLYNMFFKNYTEKVWGRAPADINADWGAQRIKGLSLSKTVAAAVKNIAGAGKNNKNVETSLIESFYYPKFGPGQLWETMKDEVERLGGEIIFNADVTALETENGLLKSVTAKTAEGEIRREADWFISSMPISELIPALGSAVEDEDVKRIASELPYRDFITVGLLVNKLKIRNTTKIKTLSDIVPDCWIYIQEEDVKVGRLQIFNNWSPYMVKDPVNTVWVGLEYFCNEGDEMWNASDSGFIAEAVEEMVKIGILDSGDVLDSVRIKVKKAYPAYFGSYEHFDKVRRCLDGFSNLYCIGRNGQHRYNNMDHSMLTAVEAVNAIKNGGGLKDTVWNVNAEKDYHEKK